MIGQRLLHYEIVAKLGEGGMGVVYKARDVRLDRFVALKVLPPEKVADPDRKRRFVQEGKAASALNHPNIITVHDIGEADGMTFIAMECVEGKTLDQSIGPKGLKEDFDSGTLVRVAPLRRGRRRTWIWAVGALPVILALGAVSWFLLCRPGESIWANYPSNYGRTTSRDGPRP